MWEFDPVIMMLAGYFAPQCMQFLHSVNGLYNLVCFAVAGTDFSFPYLVIPIGALVKAGLVMTKSLSICLSIKDFISPLLMKLSLAS